MLPEECKIAAYFVQMSLRVHGVVITGEKESGKPTPRGARFVCVVLCVVVRERQHTHRHTANMEAWKLLPLHPYLIA